MRRRHHRHPLQSFRFWFLVLSAVAMATAWKLDLLGNRHKAEPPTVAESAPEDADDLDLLTEDELNLIAVTDSNRPGAKPSPNATAGSSATVEPIHSIERVAAVAPIDQPLTRTAEATPVVEPASARRAAVSPFGPANPEFVAMPDNGAGLDSAPAGFAPAAESTGLALDDSGDLGDGEPAHVSPYRRTPKATADARPFAANSESLAANESPRLDRRSSDIVRTSNSQPATDRRDAQVAPASAEATAGAPPAFDNPGTNTTPVNLATIEQLLDDGDDIAAHRMLSQWYWKYPQEREKFQDRMERLARRIYLQPQPHYMDPYVVQAGDVLQTVAKNYRVSWEYLATVNRTDPKRIRPGQKLKVIKGPFSAVVDLSDFELTVHAHGYFVKRYEIGVGRDESSPIGTFLVEEKLVDPTYYGPDGVIEHDDPQNPLGEHWIGIGDGYGIHGTIDPGSIGRAASKGCIRLQAEDIAELYEFLTVGSQVVIRR
ncbi:MAG: L,D-transpeptidase family protein [Planctomyces sp.]|nr:L,D-transpeptidase family protein [Planctomyces sp.]